MIRSLFVTPAQAPYLASAVLLPVAYWLSHDVSQPFSRWLFYLGILPYVLISFALAASEEHAPRRPVLQLSTAALWFSATLALTLCDSSLMRGAQSALDISGVVVLTAGLFLGASGIAHFMARTRSAAHILRAAGLGLLAFVLFRYGINLFWVTRSTISSGLEGIARAIHWHLIALSFSGALLVAGAFLQRYSSHQRADVA